MNKLFKYKNGEIKIMWDECPMLQNYEYDWISKNIKNNTNQISNSYLLGVELKIYKGGRICYGMLAARVKPYNKMGFIKVSIAFTSENTVKYTDSFLLTDTFVYKGLPEEYVEQVSKNIDMAISEKKVFPQCDISFEYAANCEIGSSPMLFGIIAEIIINIICTCTMEELFNMDIEKFTEEYIKKVSLRY